MEAQAWLDAGWHVESVNQVGGEVVFARGSAGQARSGTRPMTGRLASYIDPQVSAGMAERAQALGLDCGKLVSAYTWLF